MNYLTVDNIIFIHDDVLRRYGGGATGIYQDGMGKIESMLNRMEEGFFGYQPFETILQKAAFQFQSLLQYHPFVDGMKRTGIYSSISYLLMNDYYFDSKDVKEDVNFAIYVADELINKDPDESLNEIVAWFKERTYSIYDKSNMIKFAEKYVRIICPRCKSDSISISSPYCKDCGLQFVGTNINFDGIIFKRVIRLERKTTKRIQDLFSPQCIESWELKKIT